MAQVQTFHEGDDCCESAGCHSKTEVTFCVKENQRLCPDCAEKKRGSIIGKEDEEGDRWLCEIHGGRIKYFCKTHHVIACQSCATIAHQLPCRLTDVNSRLSEEQTHLRNLVSKLRGMEEELKHYRQAVDSHSSNAAKNYERIERCVLDAFEDDVKAVETEHAVKDEAAKQEAAKKISDIQRQLNEQLEQNKTAADSRCLSIRCRTDTILSDVKRHNRETSTIPDRMKEMALHKLHFVDELNTHIEMLLVNQRLVLKERNIDTLVDETVDIDLGTGVLEKLESIIQRISFQREGGVTLGSLSGAEGRWELAHVNNIGSSIRLPLLAGSVNQKELILTDVMKRILYSINVETKSMTAVIHSGSLACVSDCTSLDDNLVACGNTSNGSIHLFTRSWKHRKEILLQDHVPVSGVPVLFDVDNHNHILAALYGQPDIYVVDPEQGITKTVTMAGCTTILDIHSMSSGDIIIQTGINRFEVYDENFNSKKTIYRAHWEKANCTVDRTNNLMYITFKEVGKDQYAVDAVFPEGEVFSERCVQFAPPLRADSTPRCHCLDHNTLIVCNGEDLLVYRKILGVKDIRVLERSIARHFMKDMPECVTLNRNSVLTEFFV